MHAALKSQNCARVCQLLELEAQLCSGGSDNCFTLILMFWKHPFLHAALNLHPSAVNCRGPRGNTLLMLCDDRQKMQTLLEFGPDVNAKNEAGDNLLHHAVKQRFVKTFDNMLKVGHRMLGKGHHVASYELPVIKALEPLLYHCEELFEVIGKCGVDINELDKNGKTAIQLVLRLFKCGYIYTQFHMPSRHSKDLEHNSLLCELSNQLVTYALNGLLYFNATLPPPDAAGRTPLLLAVQSPWSLNCLKLLLQQGVEVNVKDKKGYNAIYYLLKSFSEHCNSGCSSSFTHKAVDVDEMTSLLLDCGLEMQGIDIIIKDIEEREFLAVVFLMSLKDSTLNQRNFPQKAEIKNDPRYFSFLNVLLNLNEGYPYRYKYEKSDYAVIQNEIATGLKLNQIYVTDQGRWEKKLQVPDALSTMLIAMHAVISEEIEPLVSGEFEEHYSTVECILRLLLRFWPNPPLSLTLACDFSPDDEEAEVFVMRRLLNTLFDVGGPLPLGSELFVSTKKKLKSAGRKNPIFAEGILKEFEEFHGTMKSPVCNTSAALSFDPASVWRRQTRPG
ncbi:hypothetical protein B566_EDAN000991 [Ephemera danica]|nr:hypothetical protein B566_EDAN000991 [Ephemera danica]